MLLERKPLDFEAWIVTAIPGLAPNERRTGDRGIDRRGAMMHPLTASKSRLIAAQVKGGGYSASAMRDFKHVIAREDAAARIFVTLYREVSRVVSSSAAELGTIRVGAQQYPKLQLWSAEDHLEGRRPHLPDMADPYTGKQIQQGELFG